MTTIRITLPDKLVEDFTDAVADRDLGRNEAIEKLMVQVVEHRDRRVTLIDTDTGEHVGGPHPSEAR